MEICLVSCPQLHPLLLFSHKSLFVWSQFWCHNHQNMCIISHVKFSLLFSLNMFIICLVVWSTQINWDEVCWWLCHVWQTAVMFPLCQDLRAVIVNDEEILWWCHYTNSPAVKIVKEDEPQWRIHRVESPAVVIVWQDELPQLLSLHQDTCCNHCCLG